MRSATSFFDLALARTQLRRSAPLWLAYTALWLFLLPIRLFSEASQNGADALSTALGAMEVCVTGGLYMAFFFGLFFAMQSFSYLTDARATGAYHALPVRREALFMTTYLTTLFCQLAAIALAVALSLPIASAGGSAAYFAAPVQMFLAPALETVFFYSFAVLCMVMTGQFIAAPVFYLIGNVLILGLEVLVKSFAGNFLYGYQASGMGALLFTSPVFFFARTVDVRPVYAVLNEATSEAASMETPLTGYHVDNLGAAAFFALLGLALAAVSLLLYRTRKSEMTGATVAFPWAVPIFKYGVAFCTALAFGQGSYYLLFGQYQESGDYSLPGTIGCMVVSGLLGYYIAEALVKKSFRVLKSGLRGAALVSGALVLLGIVLTFDLTGYEGRVPDVSEIETASFNFTGRTNVTTDDAEVLCLLTEAHRAIIADKDAQLARANAYFSNDEGRVFRVYIDYTTKSGAVISRCYRLTLLKDELNDPNSLTSRVNALYMSPAAAGSRIIYSHSGTLSPKASVVSGSLTIYGEDGSASGFTSCDLTAAQAQTLYGALLADAAHADENGGNIFSLQEYSSTNSVSYVVDLTYGEGDRSGGSMHISYLYADIGSATPRALAAVEEMLPELTGEWNSSVAVETPADDGTANGASHD